MIIEVRDIHKSFKTVKAVNGIDLQIYKGQFVALLGPNGAGKTTLVEMIEGIQTPDAGEITIDGKHWKGNESDLHHKIGISLQETRFIDRLTVEETLILFASFYGLKRERVREVIRSVGLEEKRRAYVMNLSGGQRQRLALSIALINNPPILLLDEPTTGLDPNARRELWNILLTLKSEEQTSLILTTHYMEEAEQLCDYIILMHKGEILRQGTLAQLLNSNEQEKTIEFTLQEYIASPEIFNFRGDLKVHWDHRKQVGTIQLKQVETQLPIFLDTIRKLNLHVNSFECRKMTLDDLFISLTGRHLIQ